VGIASNIIFNEDYTVRGSKNNGFIIDDIIEILAVEELLEWVIEDNRLVIKKKDEPDYGEFESSNEIMEYIGGGVNAGDICRHS
jgi:hypothetical protein